MIYNCVWHTSFHDEAMKFYEHNRIPQNNILAPLLLHIQRNTLQQQQLRNKDNVITRRLSIIDW